MSIEWGSTNTSWHIDVHHVKNNISAHTKCEVKHNGDMGMGHLNGWGSYGKSELLLGGCAQKNGGLQGSTLSDHHMTMGLGPFELLTYKYPLAPRDLSA